MLKLNKIAVTGGFSSGKSSVCGFFKSRKCFVADSDAIVHELLENSLDIQKELVSKLGTGILSNGKIDRKKVATIVFSNKEKLKTLEKIIHPAVLNEINKQYEQVKTERRFKFFVAEVPLLFEAQFDTYFDIIITVDAKAGVCKERLSKKTGLMANEWEDRMSNQLSIDAKKLKSHFIIHNHGSLHDLEKQVDDIVNVLSKGASC